MKTTLLSFAFTLLLGLVLILTAGSLQAQSQTNGWEDDDFFLDWYPSSDNPNGGQNGKGSDAADRLGLLAYPNPASGDQIEVAFKNLVERSVLTVFSSEGKPLFSQVVGDTRSNAGKMTLPIEHLASGLYIVKLVSGNFERVQKVLIQR